MEMIPPEDRIVADPDVTLLRPFPRRDASGVARLVLTAFVLTFIASRILVLLIMSRRMPDLYLHMGGTHVHHLNYGIFLLSAVGAVLLFFEPAGAWLNSITIVYGIGLALTFDEFGMWLHLGGAYWQRASFDAVIIIAALLSLVASAPSLNRLRTRHWAGGIIVVLAVVAFAVLLIDSMRYASKQWGPRFERLETQSPK